MRPIKTNPASAILVPVLLLQSIFIMAQPGKSFESTPDESIRPFKVRVSEKELINLKQRIMATRWPEKETVQDATQGVQSKTIRQLADYWTSKYDWRKIEARLNEVPQFVTTIDGVDIHFIHVRSKEHNALPIILAHGWPGSIIELMKTIQPLTNPTAFGGKSTDAFDVVIPSMPGYGFSGKPETTGWTPEHIAQAYIQLMKRLGYTRYVAQGGDWGALVVDLMGVQGSPNLLAIHTNMAGAVPPDIDKATFAGEPAPSGLSPEDKHAYDRLSFFYAHGLAYALEMGQRPQTLIGIADSPVGLAAWILDHDISSYELIARIFDGKSEGLTRDDLLDNITLYWLTNTAVSASRLYWENKLSFFAPKNVPIPVAVSVFPDEIYTVSQDWARKAYPKLIFYRKHDKGGHFAAWEQPKYLCDDLREAFRSFRQ